MLATAVLLLISLLLGWKIWSIVSHELNVYFRVREQREAIARTLSSCKAFEKRSDMQSEQTGRNSRKDERVIEKCAIGSVLRNGQCVLCPQGTFSFPGWISCKKHLRCDQIQHDVRVVNSLFDVGRWHFKTAEWDGYQVIHASMKTKDLMSSIIEPDIVNEVLRNSNIFYPIGFCIEAGVIVFAQPSSLRIRGAANKLGALFLHHPECDNWIVRFRLAIDFVRMLAWLHSAPGGPVVLCNSFNVDNTFQQLAITENWELTLGAFDNLRQVKTGSLIKCSDEEIRGDFAAPEQRWPYRGEKVFNLPQQPGYSEASDVWKIPDVAELLLASSKNERSPLLHLSLTHFKCKNEDPRSRPGAAEVLKQYMKVWALLVTP